MIVSTNYTVNIQKLQEASEHLPQMDFKLSLTEPTGNFFYDPWKIKEEFKNSIWDDILSSLDEPWGEARLIDLNSGSCYHAHADVDDRWHLNIIGKESYLIDLDNSNMYTQTCDGIWYLMDAGKLHSAANFGNINRVQLVVRKLLKKNTINNSLAITITVAEQRPDFRYVFDNTLSGWLNKANKNGTLSNFEYDGKTVKFNLDKEYVDEFTSKVDTMFNVEIS